MKNSIYYNNKRNKYGKKIIIDTKNINDKDFKYLCGLIDIKILKSIYQKRFKQDQINSVVGQSFSKLFLKYYFQIPLSTMNILIDANKKPYLNYEKIFFNYSHSGHYVAVYLSNERAVGIDIEYVQELDKNLKNNMISIVKTMLPQNQKEYFFSKSLKIRIFSFYKLWVCNEAFLKWNGVGLINGMKFYDFKFVNQDIFSIISATNKLIPISFFDISSIGIYLATCNGETQLEKIPQIIDGHEFINTRKE